MSSAKQSSWLCLREVQALLTNKEKRRGDRCPPWGTPEVDKNMSDFVLNILTHCDLFNKNELNQDRIGSPKPEVRSIEIRTS